jgi:hypothetical protein
VTPDSIKDRLFFSVPRQAFTERRTGGNQPGGDDVEACLRVAVSRSERVGSSSVPVSELPNEPTGSDTDTTCSPDREARWAGPLSLLTQPTEGKEQSS